MTRPWAAVLLVITLVATVFAIGDSGEDTLASLIGWSLGGIFGALTVLAFDATDLNR